MNNAPDGTDFWVPTKYKSGIWRVQMLVAGYNGKFFRRGDEWVQAGTWRVAYTERSKAISACVFLLNQALHKNRLAREKLEKQDKILTEFILANLTYCKEQE